MSFIVNSWSVSFAIAVAIYSALNWFSKTHLSPQAKDEIALWLLGAHDGTWQKYYRAFFEAIFGERHFTLKCFFRSTVASVLSATLLFFIFNNFDYSGESRLEGNLDYLDFLLLAAAINIVPDYLSLLETRYVIRFFQRNRMPVVQLFVLLLDVFASGAIIYIAISSYLIATDQGLLSLVEMLGLFSVYSIFFYSTFLTSIWAWLFVLASLTLKTLRSMRIEKILDIWGKAPAQISLIISIYAFLGMVLIAPMISQDERLRATKLDLWLCELAPDAACPHVLRISSDKQEQLVAQIKLCENNFATECYEAARVFSGAGDVVRAIELALQGCELENGQSCAKAAGLVNVDSNETLELKLSLSQKACDLDAANGCNISGLLEYQYATSSTGELRALQNFEKGCELSSKDACVSLAWMIENGRGGAFRDVERSKTILGSACETGHAYACFFLGENHLQGRYGVPDAELAKSFLTKACQMGSDDACRLIETQSFEGTDVTPWDLCTTTSPEECLAAGIELFEASEDARNSVRSFALFRAACDLGNSEACIWAARQLQFGDGVVQDHQSALAMFDESCRLGDLEGCFEAEFQRQMSSDRDRVFITETAAAHFKYLVASCFDDQREACEDLSLFETKRLLPKEDFEWLCESKELIGCKK